MTKPSTLITSSKRETGRETQGITNTGTGRETQGITRKKIITQKFVTDIITLVDTWEITNTKARILHNKLSNLNDNNLQDLVLEMENTGNIQSFLRFKNHPLMQEFFITRSWLFQYTLNHYELSVLDIIDFLRGVIEGIVLDILDTVQFLLSMFNLVRKSGEFGLEEISNLQKIIHLISQKKYSEAMNLVKKRVKVYAALARTVWRLQVTLTINIIKFFIAPYSTLKKISAKAGEILKKYYNKFTSHLDKNEYFEAGKMVGPWVTLIIGIVAGVVKVGIKVARKVGSPSLKFLKQIIGALPKFTFVSLRKYLNRKNIISVLIHMLIKVHDAKLITSKKFSYLLQTMKIKLDDALRYADKVFVEKFGYINIDPMDNLAYVTVLSSSGTTKNLLVSNLDDFSKGLFDHTHNIFSRAVDSGEKKILNTVNEVKKSLRNKHQLPPKKIQVNRIVKGFNRLDPLTQEWLKGLGQDVLKAAKHSLSKVDVKIIDAVNFFKDTTGFDEVIKDFLIRGRSKKDGARFVMRYAISKLKYSKVIIFEMESFRQVTGRIGNKLKLRPGRVIDIFADGIKYELKSVKGIYLFLVKKKGKFGQLQKDIISVLGNDLSSINDLKWVFNGNKLEAAGITKDDVVKQLGQLLKSSNLFKGHPSLNQIILKLYDIIEVWP